MIHDRCNRINQDIINDRLKCVCLVSGRLLSLIGCCAYIRNDCVGSDWGLPGPIRSTFFRHGSSNTSSTVPIQWCVLKRDQRTFTFVLVMQCAVEVGNTNFSNVRQKRRFRFLYDWELKALKYLHGIQAVYTLGVRDICWLWKMAQDTTPNPSVFHLPPYILFEFVSLWQFIRGLQTPELRKRSQYTISSYQERKTPLTLGQFSSPGNSRLIVNT